MAHLISSIFKRICVTMSLSLLICGCANESILPLINSDSNSIDTRTTSCRDMAICFGMVVPSSIVFNSNSYSSSSASSIGVNLYFDADALIGILCNRSDYDSCYNEYKTLTIVVDEDNTIVNYTEEPIFIYSLKNYEVGNYIILVGNIYWEGIDCKEENGVSHGEDRRLYEHT